MQLYPSHETEFHNGDSMICGTAMFSLSIETNGNYYGDREPTCTGASLYGVLIGNHMLTENAISEMFGADAVAEAETYISEQISERLDCGEWPDQIDYVPTSIAAE